MIIFRPSDLDSMPAIVFMNTDQIRLHSVLLPANGIGFLMLRHDGMLTMFNV